jgi:hypothetical protein
MESFLQDLSEGFGYHQTSRTDSLPNSAEIEKTLFRSHQDVALEQRRDIPLYVRINKVVAPRFVGPPGR